MTELSTLTLGQLNVFGEVATLTLFNFAQLADTAPDVAETIEFQAIIGRVGVIVDMLGQEIRRRDAVVAEAAENLDAEADAFLRTLTDGT